jgi:isoleucyl-tRNA synthetase
MSRPYQVVSTLYHLHLYFKQNSEYDKFDQSLTPQWAKEKNLLSSPDVWILSKLQKLIKKTTELYDNCRFHEAAKSIEDFLINALSQIYIPITRGDLWEDDAAKKNRRFAIYSVLNETLRVLDVLIQPICPFTSEYLYLGTFGKKKSILLEDWPKAQESLENEKIEESFDLLKEVISISAAARMKGKLKRRWPLKEAIICVEKGQKEKLEPLSHLLVSQINVEKYTIKEIDKKEGLDQILQLKQFELPIVSRIELERKKIGPRVKQHMEKIIQKFSATNPEDIIRGLSIDGKFSFEIDGNQIALDKDDFVIDFDAKEGFAVSQRDDLVVFISTIRNREMMSKGLVNDLARRLQTLRKERGYNPTDILNVASILDLDEESLNMVREKTKDLAFLVRVKQVDFTHSCKEYKDDDVDGHKIRISVE